MLDKSEFVRIIMIMEKIGGLRSSSEWLESHSGGADVSVKCL